MTKMWSIGLFKTQLANKYEALGIRHQLLMDLHTKLRFI